MEKLNLCVESNNEMINNLSKALIEKGIIDGSNYYYTDDNFKHPFFKIPKSYKKESENDPDVHYIFIDVDNSMTHSPTGEYTVQCNYVHEHIIDVNQVAELVYGLLKEEIVEVAVVFPNYYAGFFMMHTGDHEKNVDFLNENFEFIGECLKSIMNLKCGHMHRIFPKIHPYNLNYGPSNEFCIPDVKVYMVSSIFAVHPEYYIIQ